MGRELFLSVALGGKASDSLRNGVYMGYAVKIMSTNFQEKRLGP